MNEVWKLDACAQSALVQQGELSAQELITGCLARIEALNPALNAVLVPQRPATTKGSGPLAGVPFLAKDLLPYPGLRAAMGARLFDGHVPASHVPYTQAIEDAGLACVGKTTTSEFGLLGSGETLLEGVTRSPWGAQLSPGGSSAGSAVAVAAGLVPLAHASDGGGSIRLPASLNGLFGFKPSMDATKSAMSVPSRFGRLLSEHCLTRSVRDSAAFFELTAAAPFRVPAPRKLRVGVYTRDAFSNVATEENCAAVAHAVEVLGGLGHEVEEIAPPALNGELISRSFFRLAGFMLADLSDMMTPMLGRPLDHTDLEPFTWSLLEQARSAAAEGEGADEVAEALEREGAKMRALLASVDVALCPTAGGPRLQLGYLAPHLPPEVLIERTDALAAYTAIHNAAGAAAMSVPLYWNEAGLPVGCQFAARPGDDALLFALALQLEQACPWADRWPSFDTLPV